MSQNSSQPVQHSKPIPISTEHLRHRSTSFSSDSSNSSPPLVTPPKNFPTTSIPVSSSSPILYYLSQSPTKPPPTFPFRGFAPPSVLEDEPTEDVKPPQHVRRASIAGRFQPPPSAPEPHHERGVNVLRRLSLSQRPKPPAVEALQPRHPSPPQNLAVSNTSLLQSRKSRRSATVSENARPRRAPSPMGERILKGHFDGFN